MAANYCIYCGSSELSVPGSLKSASDNRRLFHCQTCRTVFTDLELRFDEYRAAAAPQRGTDGNGEKAALQKAWKFMRQMRWNTALEQLGQHVYPLEHKLEFMIFRDVCQINSWLMNCSIIGGGASYGHSLLDMLDSNMQNIEDWLPADDEKARLQILQNVYNAVMHLGNTVLSYRTDIQIIIRKRAAVICVLAAFLQEQQSSSYNREYLGMAADLLSNALGRQQTGVFYVNTGQEQSEPFSLPLSMIKQISEMRAVNAEQIRKFSPDSGTNNQAARLLPAKLTGSPNFPVYLLLLLCFTLFAGLGILMCIDGHLITDASLSFLFNYLFIPICFIALVGPVLFLVRHTLFFYYDRYCKKRSLYNRLYNR